VATLRVKVAKEIQYGKNNTKSRNRSGKCKASYGISSSVFPQIILHVVE
jgi:hypothetical protein